MKVVSKMMIILACGIIMLHAVVPHHHHEGGGEVECFCMHHHEDDGHHHSPFDFCKLQDMLSHLVISAKDDEEAFAVLVNAESHLFFAMIYSSLLGSRDVGLPSVGGVFCSAGAALLPAAPERGAQALRAPPAEA